MRSHATVLPPACLGLALLAFTAAPTSAGTPRLYLSWHAPYGSPRASDTLSVPCGTEGGPDTLYLTFETGANSGQFIGIDSKLYFRAAVGDTLGPHWQAGDQNIQVQFSTDSVPGCTRPWRGAVWAAYSYYDRTMGSGRLQISNIRPPQRAVAVSDSVPYLYGRLLLARPPAGLPRCDQPICIEWAFAEFLMDTTLQTVTMAAREGRPLVTLNWSRKAVCAASPEPAAKPKRPEAWRPKGK